MPYLRLLFAWIVMIAIPVQGFAAASMMFCGKGSAHHAQAAAVHQHDAGTPAHDHATHQPQAQAAAEQAPMKLSDGASATNLAHKCSACASCCHGVAIAQTPLIVLPDVPARAGPGEPSPAAYSRPSVVPDKPPRA